MDKEEKEKEKTHNTILRRTKLIPEKNSMEWKGKYTPTKLTPLSQFVRTQFRDLPDQQNYQADRPTEDRS